MAKRFAFDIETLSNCFTLIARELDTKTYLKFAIHFSRDDFEELYKWLKTRPTLIGYNSIAFDGQVLEHIYRTKERDPEKIFEYAQKIFETDKKDLPYKEWDFSFVHIDLMKLNHYDGQMSSLEGDARYTSLKWLEFTTRQKKIKDLPINPEDKVSASMLSRILSYNRDDVDMTYEFYYKCASQIKLRENVYRKYKNRIVMNKSDSSLGAYLVKKDILNKTNLKWRKIEDGMDRKEVRVEECFLPYISFSSAEFNELLEFYKELVLTANDQGNITLKGVIDKKIEFDGMEYSYGYGGLHAAREAGLYKADKDNEIVTMDVKSYYPNLAIQNKFYPEPLGVEFCDVYEGIYKQRQRYPKDTSENYMFKIALNAVFGKSNTSYPQFLKDPQYTVKTTLNGQLSMTMLAEMLAPIGKILIVNTDGLEILINKGKRRELRKICTEWQKLTKLTLEFNRYKLLAMRNCNNYLAVDENDKVKRKGSDFTIYYDITEEDGKPHQYHRNPSGSIIQLALNDYFVHNTPPEKTITECDNIFEFLYAIKKQKNFEYWLIQAFPDLKVQIDKYKERVLRYYISDKGENLFKHFNDGRKNNIQHVNKDQLVKPLMLIRSTNAKDYNDLNYEHYLMETHKIIEEIENSQTN